MGKGWRFALFFALSCFVWPLTARAFEVGVAPSTRKILPETQMPTDKEARFFAAQNEWEGFQIVVRHTAALRGINVEVTDLAGPGGASIPKSAARLYREYFVNVVQESVGSVTYHERKKGLYPDPLIPFVDPYTPGRQVGAPFDIDSGATGVVYVDWQVPSGAAPGRYTGTASVMAEGVEPQTIPITLVVWDFEIPKARTIATAFGFGYSSPAPYHGGAQGPNAEQMALLVKRYLGALHEHRLDPTELPGDYAVEFDEAGALKPIDWTAFDAANTPFLDGSYFEDGVPVTRFNLDRLRPGSGLYGWSEAQYKAVAVAVAEHLQAKGWLDKVYLYSSDEPWLRGDVAQNYQDIKDDIDRQLAATPLWKDKALVTSPYYADLKDEIGIWSPVTTMYENWWWANGKAGRKDYAPLLDAGKALWFYVCNADTPPYAGYDIDSAIGYEPRIAKWGTYFEKATGFLYWRVNFWVGDDPWNTLSDVPGFGEYFARNGDGFIYYPGNHDGTALGKGSPADVAIEGPVVSYRMKQIRDGLEDWELFLMAERLGAKTYARAQVARAYTRFGDFMLENCDHKEKNYYCKDRQPWTLDENLLLEVRQNVALKVQYLLHPDTYSDPETPLADGDSEAEESPDGDTADDDATPDGDIAPETKSSGGCATTAQLNAGGLLLLAAALIARRRRAWR